jgi:hypothetical protein
MVYRGFLNLHDLADWVGRVLYSVHPSARWANSHFIVSDQHFSSADVVCHFGERIG